MEQGSSRLYTITYNTFEQFVKPVGAAMPAIAELIMRAKRRKGITEPENKDRDWKTPCSEWIIEIDSITGDERQLKEMTRTQVAEIIARKHKMSWKPPVCDHLTVS